MKFELEIFDIKDNQWKFLKISDDISSIKDWFDWFCDSYSKEHFRIIEVLEIR